METILFQIQPQDTNYLPMVKGILQGRATIRVSNNSPTTAIEVALAAKQIGANKIATTDAKLAQLLLKTKGLPSMNDYAGTVMDYQGCEVLFLPPLATAETQHAGHAPYLAVVPEGKFLYERYWKKLLSPSTWMPIPDFNWNLFSPEQTDELYRLFSTATYIAGDIETIEADRAITCLGLTAVHISGPGRQFTSTTIVIPFTDLYNIAFARTLLRLPIPKVFQNGKYDNAYLLRYNCTPSDWLFDTINLFHSWYCELPKRLDFISSFMLRKWPYWKHLANTGDLQTYYEYNARDAFSTAMILLALILELPEYAWTNYMMEFPLVFPCLLVEMQGLKIDTSRMAALKQQLAASMEKELLALRKMVGDPWFNPSSPKQTLRLFDILGCSDIKNSQPASRDKVSSRHPLNKRILKSIETYRKDRKLFGGYVDQEKLWYGRNFFSLNPHGTDTARLVSRESAFWCGFQIQNIPRDREDIQIKSQFVADEGFYFCEHDYEQAEARDTAYLSGDTKLIAAVDDHTRDFHGINASLFFGIPYEEIVSSKQDEFGIWIHKAVNKVIRQLSKQTNHGTNYNMSAPVLLDTMGIANVIRAKEVLGLPRGYTLIQVCQYLLDTFDKTYPIVRSDYYKKVVADVKGGFLVSALGWTRACFSDPTKSKHALNSYVAHPSQNLNAGTLNIAYRKVFNELAIPHAANYRLGPQIHDSILSQYRIGHEYLIPLISKCMEIPVSVTDTFGIKRTLTVPTSVKAGGRVWSELKEWHPTTNAPRQ